MQLTTESSGRPAMLMPSILTIFNGTSSKDCTWDFNESNSALAIDGGYAGAVTVKLTPLLFQ